MQLIFYFLRLGFLLQKRHNFLQLLLIARLKSRRIVEDKTGIALECERPIDIVISIHVINLSHQIIEFGEDRDDRHCKMFNWRLELK